MERILIVDDHPLVREGMKEMLQSEGFKVDVADCGENALSKCLGANATDLVVTDIRMPGMDGFAFAEKLIASRPSAKVLMLAGMPLSHEVAMAKKCGAAGYMPKGTPWRDIVKSIRAILAGGSFQEEDLHDDASIVLTPRETEILRYLALGKTFEEIAIIFSISAETVKSHIKNLRQKLDAPSSIAAVGRAYELGILRP